MAILKPPDMGEASHDLGYESDVFELSDVDTDDGQVDSDASAVADAHADALTSAVESAAEESNDLVDAVNGRTSLRSRYDALELGLHDGLADVPTAATQDDPPPAVALLRADERERRMAILRLQDQRRVDLEAAVVRRELEVELAAHRLDESMFRLGLRHPLQFDAGYFDTAVEARAAVVALRQRLSEEAAAQLDPDAPEPGEGVVAAPPAVDEVATVVPTPVRATMEQRAAASRELGWSIKPHWFWIGSIALFAAEYPFTKGVVRQLLLEPDPAEWIQHLSTISITVGFLIATKMTGILLRRAQSMFLLASLIDPERRPAPVRVAHRLRRRSRTDGPPVAMDPTEQGLRFGAWGRLAMAGLLALMLVVTVLSIANYRSDAAEALAEAAQVGANDSFQTDAEDPAPAEAELDTGVVPDVDAELLQRVFVAVSLLNVIGAVILAWAATDGTHDVVGADGDEDEDDPLPVEADGAAAGSSPIARVTRTRSRRRRRSAAVRLQDAVERRREALKRRVVDLEVARRELAQHEVATRTLADLSKAKGRLDERAYWWANLAGRRFQVDPDTERRLSLAGGPSEPPDGDIDLREAT